jgi:hypothetical protein
MSAIDQNPPASASAAVAHARPQLALPKPSANLHERVLAAIRDSWGAEPRVDEDGDLLVRFREVPVYLRISDDPAEVHIFSPALVDLGSPAGICQKLNDLNRKFKFSKAIWDGNKVIVCQSVEANPFVAPALLSALRSVSVTAAFCAEDLQACYGGTVIFGRALPPRDARLCGYLCQGKSPCRWVFCPPVLST